MVYVVNFFRPLTSNVPDAIEVMREIELACSLKFTAILNNSNLGNLTEESDVLSSLSYAEEISRLMGIPVKYTTVKEDLFDKLNGKIENLYPLKLQKKI